MRSVKISNLILLVTMLMLSACTYKKESSSVKMSFPDWAQVQRNAMSKQGSVATLANDPADISILTVNITGEGIDKPIVKEWKRDQNSSAPSEIIIPDVPRGAGRLVQVLAVYEGNAVTQFLYGDSVANIAADVNEVNITLALANTSTAVEGNLHGRYMTTSTSGPTGTFQYRFDPDQVVGGKPSMIVTTGEIFGGWVKAFALNSRLLQHTWPDGTVIFDLSDDSQVFSTSNPQSMARIIVPEGYEDKNGDGSEMQMRGRSAVTVGYFGPGAVGKRVCLSPIVVSIDRLFQNADLSNQFIWAGKSEPAAGDLAHSVRVTDPDGAGASFSKGGSDATSCVTTGIEFTDYLKFDASHISEDDSVAGFKPPFKKLTNGFFIQKTFNPSTSSMSVSWSYLPGANLELSGMSVFWRRLPTAEFNEDEIRGEDGYRCAEFRDPSKFSPAFTERTFTATTLGFSLTGVATAADADRIQAIACPRYSNGSFVTSSVSSSAGAGGYVQQAPTHWSLRTVEGALITTANRQAARDGTCFPATLVPTDAFGVQKYMATAADVAITSNDPNVSVYLSSTCTTPVTTIPQVLGSRQVYIKDSLAAAREYTLQFSGAGYATGTYYGKNFNSINTLNLSANFPAEMYAQTCYYVRLTALDSINGSLATLTAGSMDFNERGGDMKYFASGDSTCSTPIPQTFSVPASSAVYFYAKYIGTENGTSLDMTPTSNSGLGSRTVTSTVRQPGTAYRLRLFGNYSGSTESCMPAHVELSDSAGRPTPNMSGTNITFDFATNSSGMFVDGCTTLNPLTSGSIATGATRQTAYYKPTIAGVHLLSIQKTSAHVLVQNTVSNTATQAVVNRLVIGLPGQTWGTTSYLGNPLPQLAGQPFAVTLRALTPGGNLDTSFTLPALSTELTHNAGPLTILGLNWSGGIGTATVVVSYGGSGWLRSGGGSSGLGTWASSSFTLLAPGNQVSTATLATVVIGNCQPVLIGKSYGGGATVVPGLDGVFNFNMVNAAVFSDSSCATQIQSKFVPAAESSALVYMRAFATPYSFGITANDMTPYNIGPIAIGLSLGNPAFIRIRSIRTPSAFHRNICQPMMLAISDGASNSTIPLNPVQITMSQAGTASLAFHSSSDCSDAPLGSITKVISPASSATKRGVVVYVKAHTVGTILLNANDTSTPGLFGCFGGVACTAQTGINLGSVY